MLFKNIHFRLVMFAGCHSLLIPAAVIGADYFLSS